MNRDAADAVLFGDTLSCEDAQRAAFVMRPLDALQAEAACLRAEASLRAIAVIEDTGGEEDDAPLSPALRRLEVRLDLIMALLGAQLRQAHVDPQLPLRWSAIGARIPTAEPLAEGSSGLFRLQATAWLPEPLELPAVVIACLPAASGAMDLWLRFGPLTAAVTAALERHLFRQHRRAIAIRRARIETA